MANVFSVSGSINQPSIGGSVKQLAKIGGVVSVSTKSGKELRFLEKENFPEIGSSSILYIATDEDKIYRWESDTTSYVLLSGDVESLINDEIVSTTSTWSSNKLDIIIQNITNVMGGKVEIYKQTTAEWNISHVVSKDKAFYIYTDYQNQNGVNIPGIKIGDGNAYVADLPFVTDWILEGLVTREERNFWNNKVTAYIDPNKSTRLVLSKD